MLTSEMAIANIDFSTGLLHPDRLLQRTHAEYSVLATKMLEIYRHGVGQSRRDLHRAVGQLFSQIEDCPIRRVDAMCKILDDCSEFLGDRGGKAAELRQRIFRAAAKSHPLVSKPDRLYERHEEAVKQEIADAEGAPWDWIAAHLFADIMEFHRLVQFRGFDSPQALLARYNVAQVQVALFRATSLVIWTRDDLKNVIRFAKLARLMHTIVRDTDNMYQLRFDGPASVLRETRRYGVGMARFLPGLLSCVNWRMRADLRWPRITSRLRLELSSADGLHSPVPPAEEFDSNLEADFSRRWGDQPRDGWRLERESEILHHGQKVFMPDFVLVHESGRRVLLEIVGFWTPEYLAHKFETLQLFRQHAVLVAVAESAHHQLPSLPSPALTFKTAVRPSAVLEWLAHERRFE